MGLGNYILLWTQLKFFHLSGYWPRHEIIILSQADNNRCGTKAKQIVYDKRRHLWCLWPSLQRQYIITPRLIITSSLSNIDLFKTKKKLFSRNLILKFSTFDKYVPKVYLVLRNCNNNHTCWYRSLIFNKSEWFSLFFYR
jgi:hypothetical protein